MAQVITGNDKSVIIKLSIKCEINGDNEKILAKVTINGDKAKKPSIIEYYINISIFLIKYKTS